MKTHHKTKFWFLNNDGTKKQPKNGDVYFKKELKIQLRFPFIFKSFTRYELIDNVWIEKVK